MHRKGVICDWKTILVTRNLVEALRMFRRQQIPRALWADAICINQKDLEERSSQVQLMTRIYSEASAVLIWLGYGGTSKIEVALRYFCQYTQSVTMRRNNSPAN